MLHPIQMLLLLLLPLVTPTVSSFGPPSMVVDVDENGRVQFECMAAGPPEPTFLVKKTKPAPTQIKTTTVLIEYSAQQGSDG